MLRKEKYNLLVQYRSPMPAPEKNKEMFQTFIDQKLVRGSSVNSTHIPKVGMVAGIDRWVVTQAGEDALSEFEEECRQKAENKRQQRFQNQLSIAQVLVPLITFILGMLVEHISGIIGIFSCLFDK